MILRRYTADNATEWNAFVKNSKNGTFLLDRSFMDYHGDRFHDASLMFYEHERLIAVLPANYDEKTKTLYSHQGLTYGGLITARQTTSRQVMTAFELIMGYCKDELQASRVLYKPIPYIYNSYPSDEGLYALFRNNARLISRGLSSCIDIQDRIGFTESRKSGLRKSNDIDIREIADAKNIAEIEKFWDILHSVLTTLHNTTPVHSAEEIALLMSRFPEKIRLFGAYDTDGDMLAGSLIFDCGQVVHTQYMAASEKGKMSGALDKLIAHLITSVYSSRKYFDFGISTEDGGRILNEGLIFQKEGFGGRGVCYDQYELIIDN